MIPPRKAIYVLPGEPECVSHQRFQMNKVHETQRQQKVMHEITLTSQHNDDPPFDAPLHIDIKFYVDPGQKKQAQLNGLWHTKEPSLSGMVKYVELCCKGILYKDDYNVAKITASKWYSTMPRTEITLTELEEVRRVYGEKKENT